MLTVMYKANDSLSVWHEFSLMVISPRGKKLHSHVKIQGIFLQMVDVLQEGNLFEVLRG